MGKTKLCVFVFMLFLWACGGMDPSGEGAGGGGIGGDNEGNGLGGGGSGGVGAAGSGGAGGIGGTSAGGNGGGSGGSSARTCQADRFCDTAMTPDGSACTCPYHCSDSAGRQRSIDCVQDGDVVSCTCFADGSSVGTFEATLHEVLDCSRASLLEQCP